MLVLIFAICPGAGNYDLILDTLVIAEMCVHVGWVHSTAKDALLSNRHKLSFLGAGVDLAHLCIYGMHDSRGGCFATKVKIESQQSPLLLLPASLSPPPLEMHDINIRSRHLPLCAGKLRVAAIAEHAPVDRGNNRTSRNEPCEYETRRNLKTRCHIIEIRGHLLPEYLDIVQFNWNCMMLEYSTA